MTSFVNSFPYLSDQAWQFRPKMTERRWRRMSQKDKLPQKLQVKTEDWAPEELNFRELQEIGDLLYPLQWHCGGYNCGCC